MQIILIIVAVFLAGSLIYYTLWAVFGTFFELLKYIFGFSFNPRVARRKLSISHFVILEKNFPYYQKLNDKQKKKFQKRLRYFIDSKIFIPKQMDRVTDEMRVLIGACAVQLTFGLPPLRLMFFKQILIYPDKYKSGNGNFHKGEVNMKHHSIVLSWRDFVAGYANPKNGYNVGLHEFAHALKVEDSIRNGEFDFFNTKLIAELHQEFKKLQSVISNEDHPVLRKYAGQNFDEFFAVCIEYFFEQPKSFIKPKEGCLLFFG